MKQLMLLACLTLSLSLAAGEKHDHGHHHEAPHGGCLLALGEHFAHLELVLDAKTGKLTGYVLDGHADKALRIKDGDIEIEITSIESKVLEKKIKVELKAIENVLTGETKGDTSQFEAQSDALKGVKQFVGVLDEIKVKGKKIDKITFHFPQGNEHIGHDHK